MSIFVRKKIHVFVSLFAKGWLPNNLRCVSAVSQKTIFYLPTNGSGPCGCAKCIKVKALAVSESFPPLSLFQADLYA